MSDSQHMRQTRTASAKAAATLETGSARPMLALGVTLAAGLAAGVAVHALSGVSASSVPAGTTERPTLMRVPATSIGAAAATMRDAVRDKMAEEAKNCSAPLAMVVVDPASAEAGGTLSIRAGGYLSPPVMVASGGQSTAIAIPFPAPYPAGKGVIAIEGDARRVRVGLSPALTIDRLDGVRTINVWWPTDEPCER